MTEDEKNFIIDMLRTEGWKIYERLNKETAIQYRILATQRPESMSEQDRTWYSALATGREEAVQDIKDRVQ